MAGVSGLLFLAGWYGLRVEYRYESERERGYEYGEEKASTVS